MPPSALLLAVLAMPAPTACAAETEQIGSVDAVFKLLGPDHKIVVDAKDDPKMAGVICYVSRAKTGGIKGGPGLAEDRSEASIGCQATANPAMDIAVNVAANVSADTQ